MKRKFGVLMPISALPSRFGVGDFGKSAYKFVDYLKSMGASIWQILPLNPLGYGNSPYQPYSSKAMDEIYISLDYLKRDSLISKLCDFNKDSDRIDYSCVRNHKLAYLKEAFYKYEDNDGFKEFIKLDWVYNYAVFLTFKKHNDLRCWNTWPDFMKYWPDNKNVNLEKYMCDIYYEMFVQFILYRQWLDLKKYANDNGILIMGDMPIYVGVDSDDVWLNKKNFLLDSDGKPTFIAGVPPDTFSKTGQRWGNPIYDWEYLKNHNFDFWLSRLDYNSQLFDIIRIDHFRAFDTYFMIDSKYDTAEIGEWVEAPGYEFFDTLFSKYPDMSIVVEDLGDLRKEVGILRDHYNFMGMRIVQFSFDLKQEDNENLIVYTGTHDNQTSKSWYKDLSVNEKAKVRRRLNKEGISNDSMTYNIIEYSLKSNAGIAIIPITDILDLDDWYRINKPGSVGDPNWQFRIKDFKLLNYKLSKFKKLVKRSGR